MNLTVSQLDNIPGLGRIITSLEALSTLTTPFPVLLQNVADSCIRNTDGKTALDLSDPATHQVLTGEYHKEELLEAARTGNTDVLMSLLTPMNVNSHAGDGRKVRTLYSNKIP